MDSLTTHPSNAQQATAFTSPASLSFPGGAGDLTPPEKDGSPQMNGQANGANGAYHQNGQQQQKGVDASGTLGNGVTPATPAATPGAGLSGIIPTLQ